MGGGRHLPPELVTDRRQGGRDLRDPAAQGRTRQVQPLPEEDSFESIERQVIDILRDDHVRQQPFGGQRFLQRLRRRRRFDHALVTTWTGILEACRFDHPQTRWDILQFFRHGLANPRLHVTARADLVRADTQDKASTSVQLVDANGTVLWSYSVNKGRGAKNMQSMAEAIASHL